MKGLLKEKSEIEKLQEEFKNFSGFNSKNKTCKKNTPKKELVTQECQS